MSSKRSSPAGRDPALRPFLQPAVAAAAAARSLVEGVAFWLAVLLPFAYVPAFALGVEAAVAPRVLGALVAVHVATLVVGNGYRQPAS